MPIFGHRAQNLDIVDMNNTLTDTLQAVEKMSSSSISKRVSTHCRCLMALKT